MYIFISVTYDHEFVNFAFGDAIHFIGGIHSAAVVYAVTPEVAWNTNVFRLRTSELLAVFGVFDLSPNSLEAFSADGFSRYKEPATQNINLE